MTLPEIEEFFARPGWRVQADRLDEMDATQISFYYIPPGSDLTTFTCMVITDRGLEEAKSELEVFWETQRSRMHRVMQSVEDNSREAL
jgi:hypothetical protein